MSNFMLIFIGKTWRVYIYIKKKYSETLKERPVGDKKWANIGFNLFLNEIKIEQTFKNIAVSYIEQTKMPVIISFLE